MIARDWMWWVKCTRKHTSDRMTRYNLDVLLISDIHSHPLRLYHPKIRSLLISSSSLTFLSLMHTHPHTQLFIPSPVVQWPLSASAPTELSPGWTSPAAPASLCPSSSLRSEADWSTGRAQWKKRWTSEEEETRWYGVWTFWNRTF